MINFGLKNLKYFAIPSCSILIIIIAVVARLYMIHYLVPFFIMRQDDNIIKIYQNTILSRYYEVLSFSQDLPKDIRATIPQLENFRNESDHYFKVIGPSRILTAKNEILFDSDDTYEQVAPGLTDFFISHPDNIVTNILGKKKRRYSFVKMKGKAQNQEEIKLQVISWIYSAPATLATDKKKNLKFVLVMNYPVAHLITKINYIILAIALFLGLTAFIITLIIRLISRRMINVVERQHESTNEITREKEEIESESRNKSKFLANVSHELRTPLNAIIGFSGMIESENFGALGNAKYKELAHDINLSGQHLLSLINDILDFSKADEGKLELVLEEVDISKLIIICVRMLILRAEEAKVSLVQNIGNQHLVMKADAKRLKQIILNLLSNSVKFTPAGGTITISAQTTPTNDITIQIVDNGVGMEPQDLAKALSPFGQIENKLSKRYDGTGLGLPLTKKLVEMMNGVFDIYSEVGIGTTITMTFKSVEI